ncbi:hypothetical protein WME98_40420 [Sorangium sp. So ce296]|uniref:hypothetical protein n=1 Tax=Sorangium sp. So ce296 TaxID=3133296 RepID=UPI003F5DEA4E
MTTTANETIIPAIAKAFRTSFTFKNGRFAAPVDGETIVVRRAHGTTAAIGILSPASRSAEIRMLVLIAEALRAAGFSPDRGPWEVTVRWDTCAAPKRAA